MQAHSVPILDLKKMFLFWTFKMVYEDWEKSQK